DQGYELSAAQSPVTTRHLVEAVGEGETLLFPRQQPEAVTDGADQHRGILETREVDIAREVLGELLHPDVIVAPEGDPIELHLEPRAGEAGEQQFVVPELLAHAHGERIVPRGEPERL